MKDLTEYLAEVEQRLKAAQESYSTIRIQASESYTKFIVAVPEDLTTLIRICREQAEALNKIAEFDDYFGTKTEHARECAARVEAIVRGE